MKSAKRVDDKSVEILVAEDSPTQAEQLRRLLQEHGYKVKIAANGRKALEAARHRKPILIISDIVMPEMDGFALCKETKSKKGLKDIPVILLTALSSVQDIIKGLQCGADNFIRKPYDEKYLLSRIEYLLTNRELRKDEKIQVGLKIRFNGEDYFITSERQQILDLLISVYEEAVHLNQDLLTQQKELARSYQSLNGLYKISQSLNMSMTPQDVAEKTLEKAVELPAVKSGWVVLREGEFGFKVAATRDLPPALLGPGALEGSCLCREKLLSGELDDATNVLECERLQTAAGDAQGLKYHASIPLWTHERTLGLLNLAGIESGLFSNADLKTLHSVGHQVAVALERAQLYQGLEKRVEERTAALREEITQRKLAQEEAQRNLERIRALHEIDLAITSTLNLRTVLDVLLEKVDPFFPGSPATVRLLDKNSGLLRPIASRKIDQTDWATRTPSHPGPAWTVLTSKTPLQIRNMQTEPAIRNPEFFRGQGLVSFLGVPLIAQGEPLGVLSLYTKEEHEFSIDEVEFLTTLGGQAAIAIHNSQLYEEAQASLKHIRALREIDRAITSTLDLRAVLDLLLENIDLLLPYSATSVRLWNAETGILEPVACRNIDIQGWQTAGPRGVGLPRAVFEAKAPVVIPNVQTDPRAWAPDFLHKQGLVSYLGIPLMVKDEALGVLGFYTKEEHDFTSDEIELLTALARQAAIAIHNSQMYQQMANLASDLAKSNKVKEEFLSVMSHELRTPLNVVMGYTAMIHDGLLGEINPKQEDALAKVMIQSNEQLAMVNNILYATVLETQKIKVESQPLVLGDLFNQLKSAYEVILNKPLELIWDCSSPLAVVNVDAAKIKQILQNLIHNAIKFTQKGNVRISARVLESDTGVRDQGPGISAEPRPPTPGPRFVEFKVADTGIGIPKDYLPFVFERFRQVDSSETRLYGGVGVGLYIVRKFSEMLGGEVSAESEVGKGSTFTVKIPLKS